MSLCKEDILERLNNAGYQALLVGGYVRDTLLGLEANDADLATDASPEICLELFKDARIDVTGKQFKVLRIDDIELASFRGEFYSEPGKPEVWPVDSFTADAARRDYTINAMALNRNGELLDPFHGQDDLQAKLVRAVGIPDERFKEDPARLLRGVGFAVRLGFKLEDMTARAMRDLAYLLQQLPKERIYKEITKLIDHGVLAEGMRLYHRLGFLEYVLPELMHLPGVIQYSSHHHLDAWNHTLIVVEAVNKLAGIDHALAWAALFHDSGKGLRLGETQIVRGLTVPINHEEESAKRFNNAARRLGLSVKLQKEASFYVRWHMVLRCEREPGAVVRFIDTLASSATDLDHLSFLFQKLMILAQADSFGKNPSLLEIHLAQNAQIEELGNTALKRVPFFFKNAGIDGAEYAQIANGVEIGKIMRRVLLTKQSENVQKWYDELRPLVLPKKVQLPAGFILRLYQEKDLSMLRQLVNRAYRELGQMGFDYTGVYQDEAITASRLEGKEVWLIEKKGKLVATISFHIEEAIPEEGSEHPAWDITQFGVHPDFRSLGLGKFLLHHAFQRALEQEQQYVRLDTAIPAHHLVRLYRSFGFKPICALQWDSKTYPSYVMEAPISFVNCQ